MTNTANGVKSEIRTAITEAQDRIKAKMFGHGMMKKLSEKSGISKYKIRRAITDASPNIEMLEQIERELAKISKAA